MSTNPNDMINGGALLPLGSERELGGHKGYALSAMVDILTSVLSGANWGPFAPPFALRQEIPARSVAKVSVIFLEPWKLKASWTSPNSRNESTNGLRYSETQSQPKELRGR